MTQKKGRIQNSHRLIFYQYAIVFAVCVFIRDLGNILFCLWMIHKPITFINHCTFTFFYQSHHIHQGNRSPVIISIKGKSITTSENNGNKGVCCKGKRFKARKSWKNAWSPSPIILAGQINSVTTIHGNILININKQTIILVYTCIQYVLMHWSYACRNTHLTLKISFFSEQDVRM